MVTTLAHIMKYVLSISRKVILHLVTTGENLTATLDVPKGFYPKFLTEQHDGNLFHRN